MRGYAGGSSTHGDAYEQLRCHCGLQESHNPNDVVIP
jgi:hypothetical protein